MSAQWSVDVRDAWIAATETVIGPTPVIKIRTGAVPGHCSDPDSGTVLATIVLPSDWLSAPSAGAADKLGVWQDISADASGTMGHFRMYAADGVTCKLQGNITTSSGGGVMQVSNLSIVSGASFTINSFSVTAFGS